MNLNDDAESFSHFDSRENLLENEKNFVNFQKPRLRGFSWLWLVIAISGVSNLVLMYNLNMAKSDYHAGFSVSKYAGLRNDVPVPWAVSSEYNSENLDYANALWDNLSFAQGIISLSEDFVKSKGLPSAQPFPWDTSRGLYLINGYHNLHCMKSIHAAVMEYKFDKPQSFPFEHITHCIDTIRLEIMCQADDTPRYSTADSKLDSGIGQNRQCRDWSKLDKWADENTACYKYFNYSANDWYDQRQRFVFCPEGAPYIPRVEKYLEWKESQ